MSRLDEWFQRFESLDLDLANIDDICIALRQDVRVVEVLPRALLLLKSNPLAGHLYDGELIASLNKVDRTHWLTDTAIAKKFAVELNAMSQLDDETLEHDVADLKAKLLAT